MQSIVRSRTMITRAKSRFEVEEIQGGAIVQEDGVIVAIGTFDDLKTRYPDARVIGSGQEIMLPGFVNAHHHVGLTPVQMGSPDMPLELWWVTRMALRDVDTYLDTLYSAFEMIASGVTTVQHLHGWIPGTGADVLDRSKQVLRAYDDIGMRVSYSHTVRDQNRIMYQPDADLVASLPAEVGKPMGEWFARFKCSVRDYMDIFEELHGSCHDKERAEIQLAPANLHWCSDESLVAFSDMSRKYDAPLHMHLVETSYQKAYAEKRGGCTALELLGRFDLLNSRLTIGHGTWLSESDIERVADAGICICHNCSSNFRLRSGIAPLNRFEARGICTGIGLDEAGINDDRDMLQELRLVLRAHRVPGMVEADVPTTAQVFRMATEGGAMTTPYGSRIGTLEVGRAADLVLIDWKQVSWPYLDEMTSVIDAVVQRAKTEGVRLTMCAGEVIYEDGVFTRVDRDEILARLHESFQKPLTEAELGRRKLSADVLPYIREFYADYVDFEKHEPFYKLNSRN